MGSLLAGDHIIYLVFRARARLAWFSCSCT